MALPWVKALRAKTAKVKAQLRANEAANTIGWDYVDRPPGWAYVETLYTLSAPPGYELDPGVVRFIKSWCPDYIPTWEKKTFLPPYDDAEKGPQTFVRHCIARHVSDPTIGIHVFKGLETPTGYTGKRPNYLEAVLTGAPDPRATDLPGAYVALDWIKAESLREVYDKFKNLSPTQYAQEVMAPVSNKEFQRVRAAAKRAAITKDILKGVNTYLRDVSDVEAKNLMCGEQEDIRTAYSFMKSGVLPGPTIGGLTAPPKE